MIVLISISRAPVDSIAGVGNCLRNPENLPAFSALPQSRYNTIYDVGLALITMRALNRAGINVYLSERRLVSTFRCVY